jgi:hypothetical protein
MKKFFRFSALLLALVMLLGTLTVLPAAAEDAGLKFTEYDLYKPVKTYDAAPNTFEAWIKLPKSAAGRSGVILGNYGIGNSVINFEVHDAGRPRLYWTESNGKNSDWIFTNVNVRTGDWVHVAVVRDVEAGKVHCYVDGVLKQSLNIASDKGREATIPTGGLYIGGDHRGGNAQHFKGEIREAAVFSTVRDAAAIESDMISPIGEDGLLAYYDLVGHEHGDDILDQSGNGYDNRYIYNVTWVEPRDVEIPTDHAFAFAVVGDTQVINDKHPDKFQGIYDWILDNVEEQKIEFVFGLGDITERSTQAEWDRAKEALHSMDGIVPYSIVRGNHDQTAGFKKTFPLIDYEDVILESFDETMLNTCQELIVGEIKYLIFTLDYGASDAVLNWVGELCDAYDDHYAILTTHCYLFRDGTTLDQGDVCPPATTGGFNNGDHMWDKLVKKHENILMVISGHDPCDQIILAQDEGANGNIVSQLLVDPQGADAQLGGLGMVAMLYFSEDGRDVTVRYYSTIKEKFYMGANQFNFTLDMPEGKPEPEPQPEPEPEPQPQPDPDPQPDPEPQPEPQPEKPAATNTAVLIALIGGVGVVCAGLGVLVAVLVLKKKK